MKAVCFEFSLNVEYLPAYIEYIVRYRASKPRYIYIYILNEYVIHHILSRSFSFERWWRSIFPLWFDRSNIFLLIKEAEKSIPISEYSLEYHKLNRLKEFSNLFYVREFKGEFLIALPLLSRKIKYHRHHHRRRNEALRRSRGVEELNKQVSGPYNSVANVLTTSLRVYINQSSLQGRRRTRLLDALQIVQGIHNTKLERCANLNSRAGNRNNLWIVCR